MTIWYLAHPRGGRPTHLVDDLPLPPWRSVCFAEWRPTLECFVCEVCNGHWQIGELTGLLCGECGADMTWQTRTSLVCDQDVEHRMVLRAGGSS